MDLTDWLFLIFACAGVFAGWTALRDQQAAARRNRARFDQPR